MTGSSKQLLGAGRGCCQLCVSDTLGADFDICCWLFLSIGGGLAVANVLKPDSVNKKLHIQADMQSNCGDKATAQIDGT